MKDDVKLWEGKMLPCPFCGGPGNLDSWIFDKSEWMPYCASKGDCLGTHINGLFPSPKEAIDAWNTRKGRGL